MDVGVYPLTSPHGAKVEVLGNERRATLLQRGYVAEPTPPLPVPQRAQGVISASVAVAPWDERRVQNASKYDIPNLVMVADNEREGCWPTVRRAWEQAEGTHHLVLTDDLQLARGFWDALNQAVSLFPESPMSLFTVARGAKLAVEKGSHWCVSWGFTGAANLLPTYMIDDFLGWQHNVKECPHDDARLTLWARATGIGVLTPVPCLVEHGMYPSLIEDSPLYGREHSKASAFQDDVTGVDWTKGANDPAFIGLSLENPDKWLK